MAAILKPAVEIRAMTRGDLDAVNEIEQRSYPYPWTRGIFQDCLRVKYCCHVLEVDAAIAGYGIVSQPIDEAHLLNLCVHPDYRRGGLAASLLDFLMREASLGGADRMFLEVRPSNKAAVALYRGNGFRVIGRRPGYYPADQGREDAVVMVCHLGT